MVQIIFNIEDDKINRIKNAMAGLFPIPLSGGIPMYTKSQWAKEAVRRWVRDSVARWEQQTQIDNIEYLPEDDIIT